MSVILLVLGILVAGAGFATIGFGIPISDSSLGSTLIVAGATALAGGLVLIGLAAVVNELNRLGEVLLGRTPARPVRAPADIATPAVAAAPVPAAAPAPAVAAAPPAPSARPMPPPAAPPRPRPDAPVREIAASRPAAPSAVEVSAAAIERLRSGVPRADRPKPEPAVVGEVDELPLSLNGAMAPVQPARSAVAEAVPEPREASPPERSADAAAVDTLKASRLDFLFRSKSAARPATATSESFDAFWPAEGQAPSRPQRGTEQSARGVPEDDNEETATDGDSETSSVAILKSGVVDGMAYTLYADGSIEAKLPHGTVKFGSIAELRAHIENNS